jgi:hypothetical protein
VRPVQVVQEEQALAMGMLPVHGKLPARRKLALRQLVDVIRSLASLDAAPVYEDAMQARANPTQAYAKWQLRAQRRAERQRAIC